ncbi:molybdopterin molybdotransferase MoeA [Blastopirellula sp. JC732]|uniref:Molybdopterin molybdenumtransferase n=1 Tax=Blastopirellula sediminis TaxID=2894196 RepID=A0A9X1SGD2_9BACT|nr:gephyrin-like molybdotransferase Glp [Blastopirellula sediminis]MCC9607459.1 molybdopterin molybdotransferase MoeA [Blastopirellula sediminis]MCC9629248.1 molybdopterin molybdotransferase MoeA [Blastopirellula sediminis]
MISISEALGLIDQHAARLPAAPMAALDAIGCLLAEDVASDIDSPPYDKAMMDGYAVIAADLASGVAELEVIEEITAGNVPTKTVAPSQAARIMTGAPIPEGADAVVMIELTQKLDDGRVRIEAPGISVGKNIMPRASSLACGVTVLPSGKRLRALEVGILAEVGRDQVTVIPRPRVTVLSTGDELVDVTEMPGPGRIRNSNGPMLMAQIAAAGGSAEDLGIARDVRADLSAKIARGLEADILVLSGGVSAGVLDLVPSILAEQQVTQIFHKVNLKPGKPIWFGKRDSGGKSTLVFGLPGNPVSSLVCFELFVRRAIGLLAGLTANDLRSAEVELAEPFVHRGDRPTLFPARWGDATQRTATPLAWKGSADLAAMGAADLLLQFPAGDAEYRAGDRVSAIVL